MGLALKISVLVASYAILWLQVHLDYKKPWSDGRTRVRKLAFKAVTFVLLPLAVVASLAVVVLDDRAARQAEEQLIGIRLTLDGVAKVVGVQASADIAKAVRELKGKVANQETEIATAQQTIKGLEAKTEGADRKASSATQKADEARALADRDRPQLLTSEITAKVVGYLRTWTSKEKGASLDLIIIGGNEPGMKAATATLSRLLTAASVSIGNRTDIGMAPSSPRGAFVVAPPGSETQGESLVKALLPAIENLALSVQPGSRLTLHINGRVSFKPSGAFSVE